MATPENMTVGEAAAIYDKASELADQLDPQAWARFAVKLMADPRYPAAVGAHDNLIRFGGQLGTLLAARTAAEPAETLVVQSEDGWQRTEQPSPELLGSSFRNHVSQTPQRDGVKKLPHQVLAQRDIIHGLEDGQGVGHLESATSSGKSKSIADIAAAAEQAGMRTLILGATIANATQLYGKDGKQGLGRFTDLTERGVVGRQFNGYKASANDRCVVSTYQSLLSAISQGKLGSFDLILGDEAHMSLGTATRRAITESFPDAMRIGFTATTRYGENKSVDQIWGEPYHVLSIREAIEGGITAPVRAIVYKTGEVIPTLDPSTSEFTQRELTQLAKLKARNEAALDFVQDFVQDGQKGFVACVPGGDNLHARYMVSEIAKRTIMQPDGTVRNIRVRSAGSHKTPEQNQGVLDALNRGEIDVVTFVKIFEQSVDSNQINFVINVAPSVSPVRIGQLLGRSLRKKPDGRISTFVDFVDESEKKQVTALHILGEDTIEQERIFGEAVSQGAGQPREGYLRLIVQQYLYERLAAVDGLTVRDLYIRESLLERKIKRFNTMLANEGMPEEPEPFVSVPAPVAMAFRTVAAAILEEQVSQGSSPTLTAEDALRAIVDQGLVPTSKYSPTRLREHVGNALASASFVSEPLQENLRESEPNAHDEFANTLRSRAVRELVTSLPPDTRVGDHERSVDIILRRYGIGYEEPQTVAEISEHYGVTPDRIRKVESRTMARLRSHARRTDIAAFLADDREHGIDMFAATKGRQRNRSGYTSISAERLALREADIAKRFYDDTVRGEVFAEDYLGSTLRKTVDPHLHRSDEAAYRAGAAKVQKDIDAILNTRRYYNYGPSIANMIGYKEALQKKVIELERARLGR